MRGRGCNTDNRFLANRLSSSHATCGQSHCTSLSCPAKKTNITAGFLILRSVGLRLRSGRDSCFWSDFRVWEHFLVLFHLVLEDDDVAVTAALLVFLSHVQRYVRPPGPDSHKLIFKCSTQFWTDYSKRKLFLLYFTTIKSWGASLIMINATACIVESKTCCSRTRI